MNIKLKQAIKKFETIDNGHDLRMQGLNTIAQYRTVEACLAELIAGHTAETITTEVSRWFAAAGFTVRTSGIGYSIQ